MKSMFFSFLDKFKGVDSVLIESVKTAYDLCFESELGKGSCFILTFPK